MEPFVSMLQSTRQHVVHQKTAFTGRTREASLAFATETRDAGRDLVRFVRLEAKRWGRYVRARTSRVAHGARELLAPRAVEREVLARVDGTLRALDGRVVVRLQALEPQAKPAPRAKRPAARKRKTPPPRSSSTALVAGGRKQAS